MKKLTLKDIAAIFNVSVSTASKAINDSNEISLDLRKRIQAYAIKNEYQSSKKSGSSSKKSKTIGVMVPNMLNYFFTQIFCGAERVANDAGYNVINCITDESYEKEVNTLSMLQSSNIDGLIVSMAKETQFFKKVDHFLQLQNQKVPIVMVDRVWDEISCDKVVVDDTNAAYNGVKYLINTGCNIIAMVTAIDQSSVGQLRMLGYQKALQDFGLDYDKNLVVNLRKGDDLDILMTLLLNYKKIDAIIALDEMTAVEVLRIVKGRGYKVPDDISIIGFTNGTLSKHVTPALTTISQHGMFIGEKASKILINRIEGKLRGVVPETKVIKTSLIIRDTTRKF